MSVPKIGQKVTKYFGDFLRKFGVNNFQKSPNVVTLSVPAAPDFLWVGFSQQIVTSKSRHEGRVESSTFCLKQKWDKLVPNKSVKMYKHMFRLDIAVCVWRSKLQQHIAIKFPISLQKHNSLLQVAALLNKRLRPIWIL